MDFLFPNQLSIKGRIQFSVAVDLITNSNFYFSEQFCDICIVICCFHKY